MGSLPAMTPAERMRRAQHKREKLLAFLSSEGWTDLKTAGLLLDVTPKSLSRLFLKMQAEGLLAREEISLGTSKTVIWGITATGIVCCNSAEIDAAEHQLGRLRGANLPHHLGIQQLRIKAERAGWTNWKPGRLFYKTGLPVVPDAVATDPAGIITAIELERNVKSAARRAEVLSGHVMCMVKNTGRECSTFLTDVVIHNACKRYTCRRNTSKRLQETRNLQTHTASVSGFVALNISQRRFNVWATYGF